MILTTMIVLGISVNTAQAESPTENPTDELFAVALEIPDATDTPDQSAREDSVELPPIRIEPSSSNSQQGSKQSAGTPYSAGMGEDSSTSDMAMNANSSIIDDRTAPAPVKNIYESVEVARPRIIPIEKQDSDSRLSQTRDNSAEGRGSRIVESYHELSKLKNTKTFRHEFEVEESSDEKLLRRKSKPWMDYVESLRDGHDYIDSVASAFENTRDNIRRDYVDFPDEERGMEAIKQYLLLRADGIIAILDYITNPENGLDAKEYHRDFQNAYQYAGVMRKLAETMTFDDYIRYKNNELDFETQEETKAETEEDCPTCPKKESIVEDESEEAKTERVFMALDEYLYGFEQAVMDGDYERAYDFKLKIDSAVRTAEQLKLDLREFEHLFIMLENKEVRKIEAEKERELNPQIEDAPIDKPMREPEDYYYDDTRKDTEVVATEEAPQNPCPTCPKPAAIQPAEVLEQETIAESPKQEIIVEKPNYDILSDYIENFDVALEKDDLQMASIVRHKMNMFMESVPKTEKSAIAIFDDDFARINSIPLPEFDSATLQNLCPTCPKASGEETLDTPKQQVISPQNLEYQRKAKIADIRANLDACQMALEEAIELGDDEMAALMSEKISVLEMEAEAEKIDLDTNTQEFLPAPAETVAEEPLDEESLLRKEIHNRYNTEQILESMNLGEESDENATAEILVANIVSTLRNFHFEMETNDPSRAALSRHTLNALRDHARAVGLDLSVFESDFAKVDSANLPEVEIPNIADSEFYQPEDNFAEEKTETIENPTEEPATAMPPAEKTDCPTCPKKGELHLSQAEAMRNTRIAEALAEEGYTAGTEEYRIAENTFANLSAYIDNFDNAIEEEDLQTAAVMREKSIYLRADAEANGIDLSSFEKDLARIDAMDLPEIEEPPAKPPSVINDPLERSEDNTENPQDLSEHESYTRVVRGSRESELDERFQHGGLYSGFTPTDEILEQRADIHKYFVSHSEKATNIRRTSPRSVHYQDEAGAWQDIDLTVLPNESLGNDYVDYAYLNKTNSYHSYFSDKPGELGYVMLYFDQEHKHWVSPSASIVSKDGSSFEDIPATDTQAAIVDNALIYKGIYSSVNAEVKVESERVETRYEIEKSPDWAKGAPAGADIQLSETILLPDGWSVYNGLQKMTASFDTEWFSLIDESETRGIYLYPVVVHDATVEVEGRNPAIFENKGAVKGIYHVDFVPGGIRVSVRFPVEWLAEGTRQFPITVENIYHDVISGEHELWDAIMDGWSEAKTITYMLAGAEVPEDYIIEYGLEGISESELRDRLEEIKTQAVEYAKEVYEQNIGLCMGTNAFEYYGISLPTALRFALETPATRNRMRPMATSCPGTCDDWDGSFTCGAGTWGSLYSSDLSEPCRIPYYSGTSGRVYSYSCCDNGASASFDSDFTMYQESGCVYQWYQDGGCSSYRAKRTGWTAGFSSYQDLMIDEYYGDSGSSYTFSFTAMYDAGPSDHCYSCGTSDYGTYTPTTSWTTHGPNSIGVDGCRWYSFSLTAGREYTFSECNGGGAWSDGDPYLALYNSSCSNVANNDDYCGLGSELTYTPPTSGTYYLNVYELGKDTAWNYTLAYRYQSACTTPGTPTGLWGSMGSTDGTLYWSAGSPVGSPTVTYYWYLYNTSWTVLRSGSTTGTSAYVSGLSCGTTYYLGVYAYTSCNGTSSSWAYNYGISTTACCITPSNPSTSGTATICSGSSTNISATSTNATTIYWYTGGCGSSFVGTSSPGANFSVSPGSTTTYYARGYNSASGGCWSSGCGSVTITVDNTSPTYGGTTVTGANYVSGTTYYVKNGTTFYVNITHSDNVGTGTQYLEFTYPAGNYGSWSAPNIKSYANPNGVVYGGYYTSYGEGVVDNSYLDIQNSQCQNSPNCNTTAQGKWQVVAGPAANRQYEITVYMYDWCGRGVGYTPTGRYVYLDNTASSTPGTPSCISGSGTTSQTWSISASSDVGSGVNTSGYEWQWSYNGVSWNTWFTGGTSGSGTWACGNTVYVRVRSRDNVGNYSNWSSAGTAFSGNCAPPCGNTDRGTLTMSSCNPQDVAYTSGTIPYWRFSGVAGTTYNFSLGANSEDTYLHLYNSSNTEVASNDDNGPFYSGTPASLSYTCTSSGTYTVTACHFSCSSFTNSSYMTYWSSGSPYGSSSLTTIYPSTSWQDRAYSSGSMDVYRFSATAGYTYDFSLCDNSEDSYLTIYNTTYDAQFNNDDAGPWCSGVPASASWVAPSSTYYIIQIRHLGCSGFTNAGNLRYKYQPPCTTPGTPTSLTGTPTGTTSANLSWSAGSPAGSATVTYYWSVGTSPSHTYSSGYTARGTTTGTSASTSALSCGTTYYLRVYAYTSCDGTSSGYGTSGAFTTNPCCCLNTSAYGSVTMPENNTLTPIAGCNFADEYATIYNIIAGYQYQFTSSNATDHLTLRQGTYNGTCVAAGTTPLNWTATSSGTYYLHINTNSSCGTNTDCRATSAQCVTCPAGWCNVPPDYDYSISPGTTYSTTGSESIGSGECRVYRVYMSPYRQYRFSFCEGGGSATAPADSYLQLYNDVGAVVASNDDFCGLSSQLDYTPTTSGYRYLLVRDLGYNAITYNLAYRWIPGTCTACAGYDTNIGTPGTSWGTNSNTIYAGGCRMYRFYLNGGNEYDFTFCEGGGTAGFDTYLYLYNASCAQVATNDDYCGLQSQITYAAPSTGYYYLRVDSFGSSSGGPFTIAYRQRNVSWCSCSGDQNHGGADRSIPSGTTICGRHYNIGNLTISNATVQPATGCSNYGWVKFEAVNINQSGTIDADGAGEIGGSRGSGGTCLSNRCDNSGGGGGGGYGGSGTGGGANGGSGSAGQYGTCDDFWDDNHAQGGGAGGGGGGGASYGGYGYAGGTGETGWGFTGGDPGWWGSFWGGDCIPAVNGGLSPGSGGSRGSTYGNTTTDDVYMGSGGGGGAGTGGNRLSDEGQTAGWHGNDGSPGGRGGGAVKLVATNSVTINGTIDCDGDYGGSAFSPAPSQDNDVNTYWDPFSGGEDDVYAAPGGGTGGGGGGSGGGILIKGATINLTSSSRLYARGGNGGGGGRDGSIVTGWSYYYYGDGGGGGGGGRIKVFTTNCVPPTNSGLQYVNGGSGGWGGGGAYTPQSNAPSGNSGTFTTDVGYGGIAGYWTGAVSSDWTNGLNWGNCSVPNSSTDVVIPSGCPNWPQLGTASDGATVCRNITIQNGATLRSTINNNSYTFNGNLTINSGGVFQHTQGRIWINGNVDIDGTWTPSGGYVVCYGDYWNDSGGIYRQTAGDTYFYKTSGTQTVTSTSGNYFNGFYVGANNTSSFTLSLQSAVDINASLTMRNSYKTLDANGNTINIAGNWTTNGGNFTHGNNNVIFDGGSQSLSGGTAFYNVRFWGSGTKTVNSGTWSSSGTASEYTIGTEIGSGVTMNITTGATWNFSTYGVWGAESPVSTPILRISGGTAHFNSDASIRTTTRIDMIDGFLYLHDDCHACGILTQSGGLVDNISYGWAQCNFRIYSGSSLTGGTLRLRHGVSGVSRGFDIQGTTTATNGHTLELGGTANTVKPSVAAGVSAELGNVVVNESAGLTFGAGSSLLIRGSMTIASGKTFTANGNPFTLMGNWTNNGTYTHGNNTVYLTGGNATLATGGHAWGKTFYNLNISGATKTLSNTLGIDNDITITGTLNQGIYNAYIRRNWNSSTGLVSVDNSTYTAFDGSVNGTINTAGNKHFGYLHINKNAGYGVSLLANTRCQHLILTNGYYDIGTHDHRSDGVCYAYTGSQLRMSTGNMYLNNTSSSTGWSFASLYMEAGATENITGGNIYIPGYGNSYRAMHIDGDFSPSGGTVYLTGGTTVFIHGTTGVLRFNNLTINKSGTSVVRLTRSIGVSGILDVQSTGATGGHSGGIEPEGLIIDMDP